MKNLICTRCDENIKNMTDISHPLIKDYAEKCGADFMILDHVSECKDSYGKWHYRIMKMGELLEDYDRVLQLDSDIIITNHCPDIFEEVPIDEIGLVYEDVGTRVNDRRERIRKAQDKFGDIGWTRGYINTGVFLVSRQHKEIFQTINGEFYTDSGYDDVHLGYNIYKYGCKVKCLDYKWNAMSMFQEPWYGLNRFNSYIIHYAGKGIFDRDVKTRIDQMIKDKRTIYGDVD